MSKIDPFSWNWGKESCDCSTPSTKEDWMYGLLWELREKVKCGDQFRYKKGYLYKDNPCDCCLEQTLCFVLSSRLKEEEELQKAESYYSSKKVSLNVSKYIHIIKGGSTLALPMTEVEFSLNEYPGGIF